MIFFRCTFLRTKMNLEITSKNLTMSSNGFGCFLVTKYSLAFNFNCFECIFNSFLSTVLTAVDDMMANDVSTLTFLFLNFSYVSSELTDLTH